MRDRTLNEIEHVLATYNDLVHEARDLRPLLSFELRGDVEQGDLRLAETHIVAALGLLSAFRLHCESALELLQVTQEKEH